MTGERKTTSHQTTGRTKLSWDKSLQKGRKREATDLSSCRTKIKTDRDSAAQGLEEGWNLGTREEEGQLGRGKSSGGKKKYL